MEIAAVILAAGQGTRMRSELPKVLHPLAGKPLLMYAVDTLQEVAGAPPVVVIGHGAEQIQALLGERVLYAYQEQQLGTGHAVQQAQELLGGQADYVLVTSADMPLLTAATLRRLVDIQKENRGPMTMLTLVGQDPRGFGRVLRDPQGNVQAIIEQAQATPEQLVIDELNAGAYCFDASWLWQALARIPLSPKGEYYLTDVVEIAVREGHPVKAMIADDPHETIGINNRLHLAEAEALLRRRINTHWMLAGVTIIDPSTTYIEAGVTIGQDTTIWPNSYLQGDTLVGDGCQIGPNTILRGARLGSRCRVFASIVELALLEDEVDVGPYAHLRKGAHLGRGAHMGNFGEVKNSYLGPGVKMGHFSYIGDATVGEGVNIGAGTITCNFDGVRKNHTDIGAGAFIGSDTMLIAPLQVGERARTGAGAVVTKNVAPDTLVVGMPARAIRKLKKE
jgi:bifunctional UDP-N-acetylglucosamine pyrophosphorylase/glucosamine-1-phosphate N-acetyltransferase